MDSQTLRYYESYAEEAARRYEGAEAGIASLFPFAFQSGEGVGRRRFLAGSRRQSNTPLPPGARRGGSWDRRIVRLEPTSGV